MLQAYIHSRMRRRTADFLQGEYLEYSLGFAKTLTPCSTQQGETRKRGERAEDCKRSNVQSPGMNAPKVCHQTRGGEITAT